MAARTAAVAATIALCALLQVSLAPGGSSAATRVTVFGDSAATAMAYDPDARRTLGRGIDLRLELAACRRVGDASCPYDGVRPPNVIERATQLGSELGPVVVVIVGYNDYEANYAGNIEQALAVFAKAGVQRVLWLTLRESRQSYASMNDMIRDAARRHPELTVVDWNAAVAQQPALVPARRHPPDRDRGRGDGEPRERRARPARDRAEAPASAGAQAARDRLARAAGGAPGPALQRAAEGDGGHDAVPLDARRRDAAARPSPRDDRRVSGVPARKGAFTVRARVADRSGTARTRVFSLRIA